MGSSPDLSQTKDYKIGKSAKHTALRRKSKDWLARNQDNMSQVGGGNMSIRWLLFQWAKHVGLVQSLIEN